VQIILGNISRLTKLGFVRDEESHWTRDTCERVRESEVIKLGFLRAPFSRDCNGLKNVNKVITNFFFNFILKKKYFNLNFNQIHNTIIK